MDLPRLASGLKRRVVRSRWNPLGTVVRVQTGAPEAALTFDDGPDPEYTPGVLDILEKHGARATFFMIGDRASRHLELVREVHERGHAVANHTFSHRSLPTVPGRVRRAEIRRCKEVLSPYSIRLFRPPMGKQTVATRIDVLRCRHVPVCWGLDVADWEVQPPERMARRLREGLKPGKIILLHDGICDPRDSRARDRTPVLDALDEFLDSAADAYRFVTLPVLMDRGRPVRASWFTAGEDSPPSTGASSEARAESTGRTAP